MKVDGKLALVTGASSGIGAEIARELGAHGATVICVARTEAKLEQAAERIRGGGGKAEVMTADLADLEQAAKLGADVLERFGAPDVLVNNAGIGRWRAIDETDPGEVVAMTTVPYMAAFELTRVLAPAMIARGSGHILNMTSLAGFLNIPGANAYGVARWAMRGFSRQLETDLRGTGVGVSLLSPAEVDSPYFDNNPGSRERIPRIGALIGTMTPADVGRDAVRTIERGQAVRITPWRARLLYRTTPPPLMRRLIARTGWQRA